MNVSLTIMTPSDQSFLRELRSNPWVADWLFSPTRAITPEQQETWYENVMRDGGHLVWIARVEGVSDRRHSPYKLLGESDWENRVGYGQLYSIDLTHMSCECGVVVVPDYQGKGVGGQITVKILDYAFEQLGLNTVVANVFWHNSAALVMFGKCGFCCRGWLPQAKFKNGKYRDILVMSITRGEYERRTQAPGDD